MMQLQSPRRMKRAILGDKKTIKALENGRKSFTGSAPHGKSTTIRDGCLPDSFSW